MAGFVSQFLFLLIQILSLLILARVLISWVDPMGGMRASQVLRDLTEPMLAPLRSVLPNVGMFDLAPLIAMLLLQALGRLVETALMSGMR